jgi:long-chain-fatty-acid--CoA ligase ACSBG
LGFNAPEWNISFYGSIFGNFLPVGVYTTNGPEACQYVSSHSDAEVVVVENKEHLEKYLKVWDELPLLKYVIVYDDKIPENLPEKFKGKVLTFTQLLELGLSSSTEQELEDRMKKQKPGNCCTLVYTSGTTGPPKGVMLSHDNYTWTSSYFLHEYETQFGNERMVSFLPLSHVAAQILDIVGSLLCGGTVWFAEPTALQGTLVETLKEAKPTLFMSVPRVWEKIEEKMKTIAAQNGPLKTAIGKHFFSVYIII